MEDLDIQAGFWIENQPYIWVPGESFEDSQRFYLLNPEDNMIVFGKNNNPSLISELKGSDSEVVFSIIPTTDICPLMKKYFQICIECITDNTDIIRIEGRVIDFNLPNGIPHIGSSIDIINKQSDQISTKKEVIVYHEHDRYLNFFKSIIFRNKIYRDTVLDIFFEKDNISPFETYNSINKSIPYLQNKAILKYTIHRGQCKLFLNEVQFLTRFLRKSDDAEVVIYPGGCPAHHMWYLLQFFPNLKIVSIDPETCKLYVEKRGNIHYRAKEWHDYVYLKTNSEIRREKVNILGDGSASNFAEYIRTTNYRVYFIQGFMSINLAYHLKSLRKTLYISDIRTDIVESNKPYDIDIIWNLSQQYNWINILKPRAYMLKFRHPFHQENEEIKFKEDGSIDLKKDDPINSEVNIMLMKDFNFSKKLGIDFLEDYRKGTLIYLGGKIMMQPFPGVSSTETRLVGTNLQLKNYGLHAEYENKFSYYNIIRSLGYFVNPLADPAR